MKYNSDDMDRMQQDAVKRIQEMHNRGRGVPPNQPLQNNETTSVMTLPPVTQEHRNEKNHLSENNQSNFFDMLFGDKEKSLLLLLILILSSEKKGDMGLIFALIYLLI